MTSGSGRDAAADGRLREVAAAAVGLEAVLVLGAAVALVVSARDSGDGLAPALFLAAVTVVLGAGLAVCAAGVRRGRRWSRGPIFTWQLVQAGVAMPLVLSATWWAGLGLLALAVLVGVLVAGRHVIAPATHP